MPKESKNNEVDQEPLKRKLDDLIKKKSDENLALKKLLDGLIIADSTSKKENK